MEVSVSSARIQPRPPVAGRLPSEAVIADPWDTFGAGQVFSYAAEVAALAGRPVR